MNRNTLIAFAVGALVMFIGFSVFREATKAPPAPAGAPVGMSMGTNEPPLPPSGGGAPSPGELEARITAAKSAVQSDPKNVGAWIQLGNDYFDTHQRERAIEAYARAIELAPNNADVITDQGVMYRELGQSEKAVECFRRASTIDPTHTQSLYNLGIVYSRDLHDAQKAADAWNRLIQLAPSSPQAAQARQGLQELAAGGSAPAMPRLPAQGAGKGPR